MNKLIVNDLKEFSDKIYQNNNCINDYKFANNIIKELKNNLINIYDFLDNIEDILDNDWEIISKVEEYLQKTNCDIYMIGDVINLLDNIKITKE